MKAPSHGATFTKTPLNTPIDVPHGDAKHDNTLPIESREERAMRSRNIDRGHERAFERQTPLERSRRRGADGEAPSHAAGKRERTLDSRADRERHSASRDTASKGLARFTAEARTMKRENPVKFSAVERDLERLREVSKLEDPRQLKLEIQRHAALLDAEKDGPTAMRLYTRTLALSTLHAERWSQSGQELVDVRRAIEPSTVPCPIQQSLKPRPLPVLLDFEEQDQSNSPLGRRVRKLELSKAPLVRVRDELDTDPMTNPRRDETSDVFMSVARDINRTARDVQAQARARGHSPSERTQPTGPDVHSVHGASLAARSDPRAATQEMPSYAASPEQRYADERRLRENAAERERMRVVYSSERGFLEVRQQEPERAVRIDALLSTMQFAPELRTRDQAMAAHGRAWRLRTDEKNQGRHRAQEDNVMALGLLARQRDDEHHALSRVAREHLTAEARGLEGPMREAQRDDLKALLMLDASRDAQFLRREMLRAHEAGAVEEARVLALALDTHPHRPFSTPQDADSRRHGRSVRPMLLDEGRTQVSERDLRRLESELVDLRAAYALREITSAQIERAERVMRIVSSVNDRTQAERKSTSVTHAAAGTR